MNDTTDPAIAATALSGGVPATAGPPAARSAFKSARVGWVDVARGIGMILVIAGHAVTKGEPTPVMFGAWIYSFHIPLFFVISGLLIKAEAHPVPWKPFVSKAFRSLIVPYAFFWVFSFVAWLLVLRHFGKHAALDVTPLHLLGSLLYGTYDSGLGILNAPLWFFPTLFCTLILHRSLPGGAKARTLSVALLFVAGVVFVKLSPRRLPWGLDLACLGLLFLYTGQTLRPWLLHMTPATRLKCLFTLPVLLALQIVCVYWNGRADIALGLIGNPGLFLLAAFSGTLAALLIAPCLPECGLIPFIGRNTIIIFPLHLFCFTLVAGLMAVVPGLKKFMGLSPFVTIAVYVILTCLAFIPIVPLLKKLFPWLVPTPKPRPA